MSESHTSNYNSEQNYWNRALEQNKDRVIPAIECLLKVIYSERSKTVEVIQLVQELNFLQASLQFDLRLPHDWHLWLFRTVRAGALDSIPYAKMYARQLVEILSAADSLHGAAAADMAAALALAGTAEGYAVPEGELRCLLRLFISGQTRPSQRAVENLSVLTAQLGNCDAKVIDILKFPELAVAEGVFVIPTLLRDSPLPTRRIIGDLSDIKTVLLILSP